MTANTFGTPIYLHSQDETEGQGKQDAKGTMTDRIKEVLKTLQPLEKAQSAIDNAVKSLDGTGYEEIREGLHNISKQITTTTTKIVMQLSGGLQQADPATGAAPQASAPVPTAGQISGRDPLPAAQ